NFRMVGNPVQKKTPPAASGYGAGARHRSEHSPWMVKNAPFTQSAMSKSRMSLLKNQNQPALHCPLKTHWVSFRLLNEHGQAESFASLVFSIQDSQNQVHTGILDETGFSGKIQIYCGSAILKFSQDSDTTDIWYKHLLTRDS